MDERERFRRLAKPTISKQHAEQMLQQRFAPTRATVVNDGRDLDFGESAMQRMVNVDEVNIYDVPWPADPYGYSHGERTSALAVHIAKDCLAITNPNELNALRIAAMLHDVGRQEPWQRPDPEHARRSAAFTDRFLQNRNDPTSLIERTVRLVVDHTLERAELPRDPLLMALWDADSLESARFDPGNPEGLKIWTKRMARMCTEYGRNKQVRRIALRERGWKIE